MGLGPLDRVQMLCVSGPSVDHVPVIFVADAHQNIAVRGRIRAPAALQYCHHRWGFVQRQFLRNNNKLARTCLWKIDLRHAYPKKGESFDCVRVAGRTPGRPGGRMFPLKHQQFFSYGDAHTQTGTT